MTDVEVQQVLEELPCGIRKILADRCWEAAYLTVLCVGLGDQMARECADSITGVLAEGRDGVST
ncbi:hypothetical protein [Rhodococcus phenolicus]|uniref:hypothetical protein n=1 Tax=Rhodococcus phenolicus TaxID=263849 RepID=UPI00082EB50F|nr:hypothetical protein [Rhodococcus phenolicus]